MWSIHSFFSCCDILTEKVTGLCQTGLLISLEMRSGLAWLLFSITLSVAVYLPVLKLCCNPVISTIRIQLCPCPSTISTCQDCFWWFLNYSSIYFIYGNNSNMSVQTWNLIFLYSKLLALMSAISGWRDIYTIIIELKN